VARALFLVVLLLAACTARDPAELLAMPPGGRVEVAPGPAPRLDRVETSVCYARPAAAVARDLETSLAAAGWRDLAVAETGGRLVVTATRDGLGLSGVVEDSPSGCPGSRARIGAHSVPPGAHRTTAGPGLRARVSP
jgi:hypothetical protein